MIIGTVANGDRGAPSAVRNGESVHIMVRRRDYNPV